MLPVTPENYRNDSDEELTRRILSELRSHDPVDEWLWMATCHRLGIPPNRAKRLWNSFGSAR